MTAYATMFLSAFLAATIIPFSSDAVFVGMLALGYNTWFMLIAASLGNTLGGYTSFFLGKLGKWDWLEKYAKVKREKVEQWRTKISKYGSALALHTWLPFIGDVIAVALGFFRLKFWQVAIFMAIGKTLRYLTIAVIWPWVEKLIAG